MKNRREFLVQTASVLSIPLLSGCGAFKNAVNDQINPIANPGNLDGKQLPVLVKGGSGALISGTATYTGPFPDIAPVNRQNVLTFAELTQNLRGDIQLVPNPTLPPSEPFLPAQLIFQSISLTVRLYEAPSAEATASREVVLPTFLSGADNLVFDRVPDTDRYRWSQPGEIILGSVRVDGDNAKRLFALLTSVSQAGVNTNFVSASLSAFIEAGGVGPVNTAILFTFGKGEAKVGI